MAYGKTIELFLVNGTSDSLITAELSNWNGKALKIPRGEVQTCDRADIKSAGVYFLFCQEADGSDSVYIGEAENVQERLVQHLRDNHSGKEQYYWNDAVIFIGRDLNKAHIRYLEDRLVKIARECNRNKVLTRNTYSRTVLKESQIAIMEEFIDNVRVLINALNYRVLMPIPKPTENTVKLYCKGNDGSATGFVSDGGFTILKGSMISDHTVPSLETRGAGYYKLRLRLEADGTIVDRVFQSDYEFASPSAASTVVLGHTSNGNSDWKTEDGTKLKDIE